MVRSPNNHLSLTSGSIPCQAKMTVVISLQPREYCSSPGFKHVRRQTGTTKHSGRLSQYGETREDGGDRVSLEWRQIDRPNSEFRQVLSAARIGLSGTTDFQARHLHDLTITAFNRRTAFVGHDRNQPARRPSGCQLAWCVTFVYTLPRSKARPQKNKSHKWELSLRSRASTAVGSRRNFVCSVTSCAQKVATR